MAEQQQQAPEPGQAEGASEGFSEAFAERANPEGDGTDTQAGAEAPAPTDEPAAAGSGEAPPSGAADGESGTKASAFDPFAGLSPEQKAHFDKLAASERSQRGRVGALTKKLNSLSTGTQAPPKTDGEADPASQGGSSGEASGGEATAGGIEGKLQAIIDGEYGDVVGPLVEVVKDLRKQIDGLEASPTREKPAHVDEADAEEMAQAYDRLGEKHPDYAELAVDEGFHAWAGKQPATVKALLNSFDPEEVSLGLSLFKAERGAASTAAGEEGQGGNGSTATGERRERQLGGLRQAPTRGAPVAAGVPNDFKSAFKQRANAK